MDDGSTPCQHPSQLISYIAHAAPATRRPAHGNEPFLRPEIGFTPRWFDEALNGVDFGEHWHTDPAYRAETVQAMARVTHRRFGRVARIGILQDPDNPTDLITGVYGALMVPALYGAPIWWQATDWPWAEHGQFIDDAQIASLEPPNLDNSPVWQAFMAQLDWIERHVGRMDGFLNWQSVINTGYRLRGQQLFVDMAQDPGRVHHLFGCVAETMIEGVQRLYGRQARSGVALSHFTVSNCMVNIISPNHYVDFVQPYDVRLAEEFGQIGIHNCAWNADPYVPHYAAVPHVAYIDMGIESDLATAAAAFPTARRALMMTPMDVADLSNEALEATVRRIADDYGPCDLVCADIDVGVPDTRIHEIIDLCQRISDAHAHPFCAH